MTDLYAVGFESIDRNEVIYQYYSMWNLKAIRGQLFWFHERPDRYFAYVYCSPKAFDKWLYDSSVRIYGNSVKRIRSIGKAKRTIRKLINERRKNILWEHFVTYGGKDTYTYKLVDKKLKNVVDSGFETIDNRLYVNSVASSDV